MLFSILAGVITFILAIFVEGTIGVQWNMPGIETPLAVVIFGVLILWHVRKK